MEKKNLFLGGTEKYLKPEMEIVELGEENVIVTSCNPNTCTCNQRDDQDPDW